MRLGAVATLLMLTGGCYGPVGVPRGGGADPEAIPREVEVAGSEAEVRGLVADALAHRGFTPVAGDAGRYLARRAADNPWAYCPPVRLSDGTDGRLAMPRGMEVSLDVAVTAMAPVGQRVGFDVALEAAYNDPRGGPQVMRPCKSYGVLETDLVDALRAPRATP